MGSVLTRRCTGIALIALVLIALGWISVPAEAQQFKPFTVFRVIKTERFDIIFPKESESSARLLASYADRVYDQVSSLLGIEYPGRIPVTFAPHTDLFNSYYQSFPGSHIMLYDTPINLEWTSFANSLEHLFLHELTHAVSLNTRSKVDRVFHRIFGNWASPALINAPLFMVEGVTVSFESLDGFGRANDPLTKHLLRQAVHEGVFSTPFQASGVYDLPGQYGNWYEYGGLFSAWLQQTYGMEKYAELWQVMGRDYSFSFFAYRSGFYRMFRNVYGIDFMAAWNAFRDSLALNGLEENPNELFPKRYHFFSEKRNFVSALVARGNSVYVLDGTEEKIRVYDTRTGRERSFNTNFPLSSYDIDVSADNTTLLVSGYHMTGDRYRAVVTEYKTDSGRRTGRTIRGLYKARYFRDGVIGLRSEVHNSCIVYEDFNGNSEVLFRGNEELLFSGPQAVDDERIVFVAARKGIRELLLYNYVSGELFRIENASSDNEYWRYMRGLGVSDRKLFFSHNADDRMYKLAFVDLETMRAVFSDRDFSGGVFSPVSVNGSVYYRGAFSFGDGFLRFPETASSLSGTQADVIAVKPDDNENYGMITRPKPDETAVRDLNTPSEPPYSGESSRYFAPRYMSPFNFWLPQPLIRADGNDSDSNLRWDGFGILTSITDPTDRHSILLQAYADIFYRMAGIQSFIWQTTVPGFPLITEFSDMVLTDLENNPYRDTRVGLSGVFNVYPGRQYIGLSLGGMYVRIADDDGGASAYEWEETGSDFFLFTGLTLSNHYRRRNELFGTGLTLGVRGLSVVSGFEPRVEGMFQASVETRFPLSLTLYGVYDEREMNLYGVSLTYGWPLFDGVASTEYPHPVGLNLTWLGGGEASIGLFSLEIQKNLSHTYFNRFFGTLAVRNVLYDGQNRPGAEGIVIHNDLRLAQSLVLKLGLVFTVIPLKSAPFVFEPAIWGAWKFSNTVTGQGSPWHIGLTLNLNGQNILSENK